MWKEKRFCQTVREKQQRLNLNADGEIRTPTDRSIRPSSARVYQFHHIGTLRETVIYSLEEWISLRYRLLLQALPLPA